MVPPEVLRQHPMASMDILLLRRRRESTASRPKPTLTEFMASMTLVMEFMEKQSTVPASAPMAAPAVSRSTSTENSSNPAESFRQARLPPSGQPINQQP